MGCGADVSEFSKEEILSALNEVRHPVEIAILATDADSHNYFNTGSAIRTCHNYLVRCIHLVGRKKFYKKATMGAHKFENIFHYETEEEFYEANKTKKIYAFERRPNLKSTNLYDAKFDDDSILLFGSEKTGISEYLADKASEFITIEQYGYHNDHNLSTAIAVGLFKWSENYWRKR